MQQHLCPNLFHLTFLFVILAQMDSRFLILRFLIWSPPESFFLETHRWRLLQTLLLGLQICSKLNVLFRENHWFANRAISSSRRIFMRFVHFDWEFLNVLHPKWAWQGIHQEWPFSCFGAFSSIKSVAAELSSVGLRRLSALHFDATICSRANLHRLDLDGDGLGLQLLDFSLTCARARLFLLR